MEAAGERRGWCGALVEQGAGAGDGSYRRIAADVDKLARARGVQDLDTAAVLPNPRAERRRRLPASSTPQLERAWDAWQAERYQRGEIDQRPSGTGNPFRPR